MITNEAKQSIIGMRVICYKVHLYFGTHIGDVSMFLKYEYQKPIEFCRAITYLVISILSND